MSLDQQFIAVATLLLLSLLATAACSDIRDHRIPNWATAGILLTGLLVSLVDGAGYGLLTGVSGVVVGLLLFLPLYARRGMGAGDVKLLAAAGAWLGPVGIIAAGIAALAAGLVTTLLALSLRSTLAQMYVPALRGVSLSVQRGERLMLPYGPAIAVGVFGSAWFVGRLSVLTGFIQ